MSDWELYLDGNVVVAEFTEEMPSEASEYQAVNERFEELATGTTRRRTPLLAQDGRITEP